MKITWLTYVPMFVAGGTLNSTEADGRYRVAAPVRELHLVGHDIEVLHFAPNNTAEQMLEWISGEVVIFGKLVPVSHSSFAERAAVSLQLIERLQARGVKIIADINDDHFENPQRGEYFRELAVLADAIVASTPPMARTVCRYTTKPVMLARDPCEGICDEPRFAPARSRWWDKFVPTPAATERRALKLMWFGYPANLNTLISLEEQLLPLARRQRMSVEVITSDTDDAVALCSELQAKSGHQIQWHLTKWSLAKMRRGFVNADLVVLPSDADDPTKAVKSPNRLVNAIWAGRFAVANSLPAYAEFRDFAWVGDDISQGVRWALANEDIVASQIRRGQEYIRRHYSPFTAAREWEHAIASVCGEPAELWRARALPVETSPLRLNLGCGNKILPGYINVDVAASRSGKKPDVVCDLRELVEFDDDVADEILSVHVIEHFWQWEVHALLQEWVRVLKPGGRMIIECPNLGAACEALLIDPDRFADSGKAGETTMWALYGDPAWQDPLMCHRWGYTPASLAKAMQAAGLIDVRQEPAQFKMREPRDMRVVGHKIAAAPS